MSSFAKMVAHRHSSAPWQLSSAKGFNECAAAEDPGNVRWAHAYRIFRFAPDLEAIVLRAPSNLGYAGGVNACIGAAGETWDAIWVLNPDTFPAPAALSALIRHQWEGDYGIVGSRLVFVSNGLVQTRGGIEWIRWLVGAVISDLWKAKVLTRMLHKSSSE